MCICHIFSDILELYCCNVISELCKNETRMTLAYLQFIYTILHQTKTNKINGKKYLMHCDKI